MRIRTTNLLAITAALAVPGSLLAAERGLMGINLYDSGVKVVQKFGSPNDIEAINFDGQSATGGGGGGGTGGGGGGGFSGGGGAGNQTAEPRLGGGYVVPPMGMHQMGGIVPPGRGGSGGPSAGGGGGAGGGGTAGSTATQYVRWIYRRGAGSSVNFVLNKFNKVVQIEVIGIANSAARTSKGVTLGSAMSTVIQKYGDPDGYDIATDYFMVRFLRTNNVAFRFARENNNTPYRCTGIVVSAGKA